MSGLIEVPADAVRLILEFDFGQSDPATYGISWYATRAEQAAAGLKWAVRWEGGTFSEFRKLAAESGLADLVQEAGLWEYLWHGRPTPAATFGNRNSWNLSFGVTPPMTALTSRLRVDWQPNYVDGSYGKSQELVSPYADRLDDRSGRRTDGTDASQALQLAFVNDDATALAIGAAVLATRDRQAVTGILTGSWEALAIAKGDTVVVESPVLDDWGGSSIWFRVLGKLFPLQAGQGIVVTLLGLPASLLTLSAQVSLRIAAHFELAAELALNTMRRLTATLVLVYLYNPTLSAEAVIGTRTHANLDAEVSITFPGGGTNLLAEDGTDILAEDGFTILEE